MEPMRTASDEQRIVNIEEQGMAVADYCPAVYKPREMPREPDSPQEGWNLLATGEPALWLE